MPHRTIRDARHALEQDVRPFVTDYTARRHELRLQEAEGRARERAETFVAERVAEVEEARDVILRELTGVRDQLQELVSEGKVGRLSAEAYAERVDSLRARQRQAEERLAKAEEAIEQIAAVEDDPIAWADSLSKRFPRLREQFPW